MIMLISLILFQILIIFLTEPKSQGHFIFMISAFLVIDVILFITWIYDNSQKKRLNELSRKVYGRDLKGRIIKQ